MHGEVVFAAVYAVLILAASAGLERVGRTRISRRSRTGPAPPQPVDLVPWPDAGSVALHTAVAAAAATAATLLAAIVLARHHQPLEAVTLAPLVVLGIAWLQRLVSALRHASD